MRSVFCCLLFCFVLPAVAMGSGFLPEGGTGVNKALATYLNSLPLGTTTFRIDDMAFRVEDVKRSGFTGTRWTNGVVYYEFDPWLGQEERDAWLSAAQQWEAVAQIRFVEHTHEGNFIYVFSGDSNWSHVGMLTGGQQLSIYNWDHPFVIVHEIGHALGMQHEHSRSDRDDWVIIHFENIGPDGQDQFDWWSTENYGVYDFDSVMHYDQCAFSIFGDCEAYPTFRWTIEVRWPWSLIWQDSIGQRTHLSDLDKYGMAARYYYDGGVFGEMPDPAESRYSHVMTAGKARVDTMYVYGGPNTNLGKFQNPDGTTPNWQGWTRWSRSEMGNFSKLWWGLDDAAPCAANSSPQVAFVDDGLVVPGTGGSPGLTWTYGPGQFVVNSTGGLGGANYRLHNEVWSPVLTWPGGVAGGQLRFDVYSHLPLVSGLFYIWHIRSSSDGGATWTPWLDRNMVYYSNAPAYVRESQVVSDLLTPNTNRVQVALGVLQWGQNWGLQDSDVTPAPYFDNVALVAYEFPGPTVAARNVDLFQDNFPAIGEIDLVNLANNSIRLDMSRNISPPEHLQNDPGDSVVVDISYGDLLGLSPVLVYKLKPNPLFDPFRTSGLPNEGFVLAISSPDAVNPNLWCFDLPDAGFFFPGDILHYYIKAELFDGRTTILPVDTTGFQTFPGHPDYIPLRYPGNFVVRGLPSLKSPTPDDQPRILLWNDCAERGGENEWIGALTRLGFVEGQDFDVYCTHGPSSCTGNGLGGRATVLQLAGYETILYSAGDLGNCTLSTGDYALDAGDDIAVLDAWLWQANKSLLCTGDNLVHDLGRTAVGIAFRNTWLSVALNSDDIRPLINNQVSPTVVPVAGNPVGLTLPYIAYGGCPVLNRFDAVTTVGAAQAIATFADPVGNPNAYPFAAAVYNAVPACNARVVVMPYDFMSIRTPAGQSLPDGLETRAAVLRSLLLFFGHFGQGPATGVASATVAAMAVRSHPNPFNPRTTLSMDLPVGGRVRLEIYDVRGRRVRSLIDADLALGSHEAVWDGRDSAGRAMASGSYFARLSADGRVETVRMGLVR